VKKNIDLGLKLVARCDQRSRRDGLARNGVPHRRGIAGRDNAPIAAGRLIRVDGGKRPAGHVAGGFFVAVFD
jgi:hypothetical protein